MRRALIPLAVVVSSALLALAAERALVPPAGETVRVGAAVSAEVWLERGTGDAGAAAAPPCADAACLVSPDVPVVPDAWDHVGDQPRERASCAEVPPRTYVNTRGETVRSPCWAPDGRPPPGATAQCRDGAYSFSRTRQGSCSGHRGVARWL